MACNCGKSRRLPKIVTTSGQDTSTPTHVWFYAIPPEGASVEPSRFATLREARWFAQRQGAPGWTIEGRRESDTPEQV